MLRPENDTCDHDCEAGPNHDPGLHLPLHKQRRPHVTIDGRIYLLTQWTHLQALANNIECPESSGWAFGDVGDRRYAAWYGGAHGGSL